MTKKRTNAKINKANKFTLGHLFFRKVTYNESMNMEVLCIHRLITELKEP